MVIDSVEYGEIRVEFRPLGKELILNSGRIGVNFMSS